MLSVERIHARRGGQSLWGPLSFELRPGQALHVRGRNGCGKTTLLRTLVGLRTPTGGRIVQRPPRLWWLGHASPFAADLSVGENFDWWLDLNGAEVAQGPRRHALEALELPPRRPVRQLSAGQRRKLGLACLLCEAREAWVLDEPFDVLDQTAAAWLAQQAQMQVQRGGIVVLTSHQHLPEGFPPVRVLDLPQGVMGD